jgi:hypothetical protein
LLREESVLKL